MKYQSRHDLLDPDVPVPDMGAEFEDGNDPTAPDDAYVIGENGSSLRAVDLRTGTKAQPGLQRWAKPAAFVLGLLFLILTAWNLSRLLQGPPAPPKPTTFQSKQGLYLGVMKVDAYRRAHGVTPDSLAAAGLPEGSVYAYRRVSPTRYVLSFGASGSKIEYDSNEPKDQFFGSPQDMLTIGGSK
jgi:hypothetical protein